jgi:hypothetical protein
MKKELIKKSKETGELQLTFWEKETHYGIVIYLLVIPTVFLFFFIKDAISGDTSRMRSELVVFGLVATLLSFLAYRMQKKRLRFTSVDTNLAKDQLTQIIELTAKEFKWTPSYVDDDVIVAKTSPGFWSGSWGEQITIIFDNGKVFINSICDPDKRSSVFSNGRNTQIIDLLVKRVKAASR